MDLRGNVRTSDFDFFSRGKGEGVWKSTPSAQHKYFTFQPLELKPGSSTLCY